MIKNLDEGFGIDRYGEMLAESSITFEPLFNRLHGPNTIVDRYIETIALEIIKKEQPGLLGLSVPFPGNVYGALRIGKIVKEKVPDLKIVMGGGFPNTALRDLEDTRVFDFIDYILFDDGERPLLNLIDHIANSTSKSKLLRTMCREDSRVVTHTDSTDHDIPQSKVGTPTYDGLPWELYLKDTTEANNLNFLSNISSTSKWNKITLAHGCYWRKCTFCDINLDYIDRYDASGSDFIVDRMNELYKENGIGTFHFVDEACPPVQLARISKQLVKQGSNYSWYGNIRFDKAFNHKITASMAKAGCVGVTGGIEVASDRLLKLIDKGTSVKQVTKVCQAFRDEGIIVHGYLIFGFPTQTLQETVDSLEVVRQLFEENLLHSAFWHQFSVTKHSPIGLDPGKYKIQLYRPNLKVAAPNGRFALYRILHRDLVEQPKTELGVGLNAALNNYMFRHGFDVLVHQWFAPELNVPKTSLPPDLIKSYLVERDETASLFNLPVWECRDSRSEVELR